MMNSHSIQGCGVGLRFQHIDQVLAEKPAVPWFEVLSDNYLIEGSVQQDYLLEVAEYYPLTFHGVGLSLGSTDPLNQTYLKRLKALEQLINPVWISDHLCWTGVHHQVTHDLIPLPYTKETISHVADRIQQVQDVLGRRLVIENVSSYLQYEASVMSEWEFLVAVVESADCDLLLDVNNIYVSSQNHDFDAQEYLRAIPKACVKEIHLAGYEDKGTHLLDTHGQAVTPAVWELYEQALELVGKVPTLIEWDNNIPSLERLLQEAETAQQRMDNVIT